jgi:putative endopeptidase
VIPAGIAQPPFFSTAFDEAVNYGGLGTVIGHEITHGFDDQGRKYDQKGNLRDWWQPLDLENFNKLAQLVSDQFSSYTVLDGKLNVNGPLVLGESIADLGGLRLSLAAYHKKTASKPAPSLDGFTPEQRFFLAYARLWATHTRADYERLQINVDVHPPARHRVNGPLSNLPEFAKAFQCPPGSPMVRPQSIRIW